MTRPLSAVLLIAAWTAGCVGPSAGVAHDLPELPLLQGPRALLRSDLSPAEATDALARLEALEAALDTAYPFVPAPGPATVPRVLVLSDPARFALVAREHGVAADAGAFVCTRGEVVAADRPEEAADAPPYPLEPPVRPLAAALLRRRLLATYAALPATWLEEGLAAAYVDLVADDAPARAATRRRERLLDAYLPLFLGGEPALRRTVEVRGRDAMQRFGSRALAWAAVSFLLAAPERAALLARALEQQAAPGAAGPGDDVLAALDGLEPAFEAWLQAETIAALLEAVRAAPHPVDRWESAAALRLLANVDLDAEAEDVPRARQVAATPALLEQHPPPVRFLDAYAEEIAAVASARNRLRAMASLRKRVAAELERRVQGYGHPAIERARAQVPRALQRRLAE